MTFGQIILAIVVAFLWAICFPLIELGHQAAPPLRFAGVRSLIAGLSLAIPILFINRRLFFDKAIWKHGILISLTYTVLGFGGMFLAGGRIAPGLATVLANTQPLIAAVLAYFILEERLDRRNQFGLFLGFLGIVMIAVPRFVGSSFEQGVVGIGFILLGAFGTGSGNVLMKRSAGRFDRLALTGLQLMIGAAVLLVISEVVEPEKTITWNTSFVWVLVILAIPGTSLATVIWLYLLERTQLLKLNLFTFLTPVFGLVAGFMFFQERYSIIEFLGIFTIFAGLYFATRSSAEGDEDSGK